MMKIWILACIAGVWTVANAQSVSKVLVSGTGGIYAAHDLSVEDAFRQGYSSYDGTEFSGTVTQYVDKYSSLSSSFSYAKANGYQVIIRSYQGISSASKTAANYPAIKAFMPAGSNSYVYVYTGDVASAKIVITGAGEDRCVTGYSVEFFSIDPVSVYNYSSFSNGYIAGQICYIANRQACTVEQARQYARLYASNRGTLDKYDGYGKISVGTVLAATAMPVELSAFIAIQNSDNIILQWRTESEVNNYGFDIEKYKITNSQRIPGDADWKKIGFVPGKGNSNSPSVYSFSDYSISGTLLYRLKQTDLDGHCTYSNTISVSGRESSEISLDQNYPNPFNSDTQIRFKLSEKGYVTLKVYDILGREAAVLVSGEMDAGEHNIHYSASRLSSGTYIYELRALKGRMARQMIIVK
jgi:hypothetical protein